MGRRQRLASLRFDGGCRGCGYDSAGEHRHAGVQDNALSDLVGRQCPAAAFSFDVVGRQVIGRAQAHIGKKDRYQEHRPRNDQQGRAGHRLDALQIIMQPCILAGILAGRRIEHFTLVAQVSHGTRRMTGAALQDKNPDQKKLTA
jgi:hypothetical protein